LLSFFFDPEDAGDMFLRKVSWFQMFVAGTPAILIEDLRSFPQSLQENSGLVPRLSHNDFRPNPVPIRHLFFGLLV
jgi:hypothetical protein